MKENQDFTIEIRPKCTSQKQKWRIAEPGGQILVVENNRQKWIGTYTCMLETVVSKKKNRDGGKGRELGPAKEWTDCPPLFSLASVFSRNCFLFFLFFFFRCSHSACDSRARDAYVPFRRVTAMYSTAETKDKRKTPTPRHQTAVTISDAGSGVSKKEQINRPTERHRGEESAHSHTRTAVGLLV